MELREMMHAYKFTIIPFQTPRLITEYKFSERVSFWCTVEKISFLLYMHKHSHIHKYIQTQDGGVCGSRKITVHH